jgi:hypothetical protein
MTMRRSVVWATCQVRLRILLELDKSFIIFIEFAVNFDGAFIGELQNETVLSDVHYFLATRLLRCGHYGSFKKFTGNLEISRPKEPLSEAIQAFAHFSLKYTQGCFLLCDIQGVYFHL